MFDVCGFVCKFVSVCQCETGGDRFGASSISISISIASIETIERNSTRIVFGDKNNV